MPPTPKKVTDFHEKIYQLMKIAKKNQKELAALLDVHETKTSSYVAKSKKKNVIDIADVHFEKYDPVFKQFGIELVASKNVVGFLIDASADKPHFISQANSDTTSELNEILNLDIIDLLDKIKNGFFNKPNYSNLEVKVEGTLFPALLLCPGWWYRKTNNIDVNNLQGCNEIQTWLFTGFEQWAPSWEISLEKEKPWLIAQLAGNDEADSIALIIDKENALEIREKFYKLQAPFSVEVTGTLYQRKDLPDDIKLDHDAKILSDVTDYCIVVRKQNKNHEIKISNVIPFYTGYLWQCCIPEKKYLELKKTKHFAYPKIQDVYFFWEHTNFGSKEAVEYNLYGLKQKIAFVENKINDKMLLIQNSSIILDGESQLLSKDFFYQMILKSVL